MIQYYSNPKRDALPDTEVFYVDHKGHVDGRPFVLPHEPGEVAYGLAEPGWYWWPCFPGCLPDGDPLGPFTTCEAAVADCRLAELQEEEPK
jgi:hypothetical protein